MKELFIHHHMGIGDHIALNGMVHTILEDGGYDIVHLFCHERSRKMLGDMYTDNRIHLIGVPGEPECPYVDSYVKGHGSGAKLIRIGFDKYVPQQNVTCDQAFYEMAGIPYENRFSRFKMTRNQEQENRVYSKLNPANEEYIFVHDDPSRGYTINVDTHYKIIKNDPSESVFHYGKIIENAKEFHCIESCFRCLSETLNTDSVKLVHHNSVRSNIIATRKTWEVR